jgi:hypothetical protein
VQSFDVVMLCNIAKNVFAKSRKDTNASLIIDLINEFLKLNEERNRVAHGLWVPSQGGGTVHHVSRNKLKSNTFSNRALELEKRGDEANDLRFRLENEFTNVLPD